MIKLLLNFWVYILPLPLFFTLYYYWVQESGSVFFASYLMILPLLYGYIVPGIATNIMKKWRFKGKMLLGNYYAHHGFKYSANVNLWFFVAFSANGIDGEIGWKQIIAIIISTAMMQGFTIWLHDTLSVKHGKLELNNPYLKSLKSPEAKVFQYAPVCFVTIQRDS